jgi:hypothetical protein
MASRFRASPRSCGRWRALAESMPANYNPALSSPARSIEALQVTGEDNKLCEDPGLTQLELSVTVMPESPEAIVGRVHVRRSGS